MKISPFFLIVICSFLANPAYAYLDPGTGSMLVSTLIAVASTVLYMGKGWFYKIFKGDTNAPKPKNENTDHEIIIWSEGKHYWPTFVPIVEYLQKHKVPFTYMASDKDDMGLQKTERNRHVEHGDRCFSYLNRVQGKIMVMTTPNLGDLAIKRSKHIEHYVHVVHAPTDMHTYRRLAFECFDTVMCAGEHQIKTLRLLEKMRQTEAKNLLETGCLYYDSMSKPETKSAKSADKKTVLLAPKWGVNNILHYYNILLPKLLEGGFHIIIRPHPQSFISEKSLIKKIQQAFPDSDTITWDKNVDNTWACQQSDIMVAHITSGVVFDYAFVHQKPVLLVDIPSNYQDMEGADLENHPAWQVTVQNKIFKTIHMNDISSVADAVNTALKRPLPSSLGKKYLYNFQSAGDVAGKQLVNIYNGIKNHA